MFIPQLVNSFSNSNVARSLSTPVSQWSGLILTTSAIALIGLTAYRWSRPEQNANAQQRAQFQKIRERVSSAYAYVFGGLCLTALSVAAAHASGIAEKIFNNNYYYVPIAILTTIASLVASLHLRQEDLAIKHVALAFFNVGMGMILSPIGYLSREILAQAAFITLGLGSVLTFTAFMSPDRRFLAWEGPLLAVLSTISLASLVALFFPHSAFAYAANQASLYGSLLLFSFYLMSSTQQLIQAAETQNDQEFDPIAAAIGIYSHLINLFIRILPFLLEKQQEEQRQ